MLDVSVRAVLAGAFVACFATSLSGCKDDATSGGAGPSASTSVTAATSSPGGAISLNGAGATFPYPLYSKWVSDYQTAHPDVRINYQSIGSGAGIRLVTERTVDFGASDAPMTDEQLAKAPSKLVHIPMTLGAVAISYNLPAFKGDLKLSPDTLAAIFLGDVKNWNDAKIVADNPGAELPAKPISVVHRTDGSGTTAVFTDYLSKVSPAWKSKVGTGTAVSWPAGIGAKGNEGVAGQMKTTPASLGYVELAFAVQSKFSVVSLKNKNGKFVAPTLDGITAAASTAKMPDDMRVSITDAEGDAAYPISAFTYVLVYQDAPENTDTNKAKALAQFLWWGVHDGQKTAPSLNYAPLPDGVVKLDEAKLKTLTAKGAPLL